ncbi:uncharacterized protein [Rutidosis leptorrhynchoides]|uniref:uncharacterized protein n=1 Tax=Rutidosis leptorrhynchoides TaxID=125765 RepID=UPI003A999CED
MEIMGFGLKWRKWILACLKSASILVLVNGSPISFNFEWGVRQGDPLSPFLFILTAEGLNILTKMSMRNNFLSGVEIGWDKVNFHISNLIGIGVDKIEVENMARLFHCKVGTTPFIYLGLPVGGNMKKQVSWKPVLDKFEKRLSNWRDRSISFLRRWTLVNSVLNSLLLYYFSLFRAPPCVLKKLECVRRSFLGAGRVPNQKSLGLNGKKQFYLIGMGY